MKTVSGMLSINFTELGENYWSQLRDITALVTKKLNIQLTQFLNLNILIFVLSY